MREHGADHGLRQEHCAAQVDGHDPVEILWREIEEITPHDGPHAGIVDETVNVTEFGKRPFDERRVRGDVGDVARVIARPATAAGEVLQQCLALCFRHEIGHGEIEVPRSQRLGDGAADTPASAGDDGDGAAHHAAKPFATM